ncbi:ion transporter [Adlercreutzia murintestinalis]|uniref:ion transporter n=1 Tax=Adlercreutzia murintestinalis TaxID=2941325 RepID=UPI00203BCD7D|nr:ion transporter [Adlercreutzia murintestinalis]
MPNERKNTVRKESSARRAERASRRVKLADASELKRQAFYALEDVTRAHLPARIIGYALFVLIVLNAIVVFVSAQPGLDPITSNVIVAFYTFSTVCFFIEYLVRIWIADLAFGDCTRARARLRYLISPLGIIDLLSFAPNVVAWFVPMTPALRTLVNVVRLVRLVKISRYMRGLRTIGRVLEKRRHEIVASFLVIALLIVVSSVIMYEIEHPAQPDRFNNLLSGIYWAVTTITATGYGDLVPITPLGRIVGSFIMFLSVALVAIPGGIFSAGFVAEFQNASNRRIQREPEARERSHTRSDDGKGSERHRVDEHERMDRAIPEGESESRL